MKVVEILEKLKCSRGANAKKEILQSHSDNELLKKVLLYGLDSSMPFHLVKVPATITRHAGSNEAARWSAFFAVADLCASRAYTGNFAIQMMGDAFCVATEDEEKWMRKILKKHLAIGASTKTINSVFAGLIPSFEVALAQKFSIKRLPEPQHVAVEPKYDGIRCLSVVEGGNVEMYTRSGKLLTNFNDNIAPELLKLGDGCYDGELMGKNFTALMRQAYRKENLDVTHTYYALFDFLPLEEWKTKETKLSTHNRHEKLLDKMCEADIDFKILVPVERQRCEKFADIQTLHDEYVADGFEGAMIKDVTAPYKFGRSYSVMKLKGFHDTDLKICGFVEGSGRHKGKLGAVVVSYNGVLVQVGSGFSDTLRLQIWSDRENFLGQMIEIRYQEVTPDGSLRFPTFVCFRKDRE